MQIISTIMCVCTSPLSMPAGHSQGGMQDREPEAGGHARHGTKVFPSGHFLPGRVLKLELEREVAY
jgi:hypothetical protein